MSRESLLPSTPSCQGSLTLLPSTPSTRAQYQIYKECITYMHLTHIPAVPDIHNCNRAVHCLLEVGFLPACPPPCDYKAQFHISSTLANCKSFSQN